MKRTLLLCLISVFICVGSFISIKDIHAQACSGPAIAAGTCGMTGGGGVVITVPGYCLRSVNIDPYDPSISPQTPKPSLSDMIGVEEVISPVYCPLLWNLDPDSGSVVIINPDTDAAIPLIPATFGLNWNYGMALPAPGYVKGVFYLKLDGTYMATNSADSTLILKNSADAATVSTLIAEHGKITLRFGFVNTVDIPMSGQVNAPKLISIVPNPATISTSTVSGGTAIQLTGSGFDALNNTVKFANTVAGAQSLKVFSMPSAANGSVITLKLASTTVPGTYSVQVSGPKSVWSNSLPFTLKKSATTTMSIPSNLTAVISSSGKVSLSWTYSSDSTNDVAFEIERSISGKWVPISIQITKKSPSSSYSYSDDVSTTTLPLATINYRVVAVYPDGSLSLPSAGASVSNCVALSGSGPIKIVFARDRNTGLSLRSLRALATNLIMNGFKGIEPFRTYFNTFSFYMDMSVPLDNAATYLAYVNSSACGNIVDSRSQYIYYYYQSTDSSPGTSYGSPLDIVTVNVNDSLDFFSAGGTAHYDYSILTPLVEMHEFGHGVGDLQDEYLKSVFPRSDYNVEIPPLTENCTTHPSWDYRRAADNQIYGSVTSAGCSYLIASWTGKGAPPTYYRPSVNGIMNTQTPNLASTPNEFNVIDCGYLIAAFDLEGLTQANASKHWPECLTMAQSGMVIKDGIPREGIKPSIKNASMPDAASFNYGAPRNNAASALDAGASLSSSANGTDFIPGSAITIIGSGFTATDNAVHFTNTATGDEYDVSGLPSNGTKITATVPVLAVPGPYAVEAGAFNSPWSDPIGILIVGTTVPGNPSPSPSSANLSGSPTQTPTAASNSLVCPSQPFPADLLVGSTGQSVSDLQSWLISAGFDIPNISANIVPAGYFGNQTSDAVSKYQNVTGIPATGAFGPITRAKVNAACGFAATSPSASSAASPAADSAASPSSSYVPLLSPLHSPSPSYSPTPSYSSIPWPSYASPSPTYSPIPSYSPAPVHSPSPSSTYSPSPSLSSTPSPAQSPLPSPSPTNSPSPTSTASPTPTITAAGSPMPSSVSLFPGSENQANILQGFFGNILNTVGWILGR